MPDLNCKIRFPLKTHQHQSQRSTTHRHEVWPQTSTMLFYTSISTNSHLVIFLLSLLLVFLSFSLCLVVLLLLLFLWLLDFVIWFSACCIYLFHCLNFLLTFLNLVSAAFLGCTPWRSTVASVFKSATEINLLVAVLSHCMLCLGLISISGSKSHMWLKVMLSRQDRDDKDKVSVRL